MTNKIRFINLSPARQVRTTCLVGEKIGFLSIYFLSLSRRERLGQRAEGRGQRAEGRGQRAEGRGRSVLTGPYALVKAL